MYVAMKRNGRRFDRKSELIAEVNLRPDNVVLVAEGIPEVPGGSTLRLQDITGARMVFLVGPSSHDRRWYSNISRRPNGTIKVN